MPKKSMKNTQAQGKNLHQKKCSIFHHIKKLIDNLSGKASSHQIGLEDSFEQTIDQIKISAEKMSEEEKNIFRNFLLFGHKTVAKVMIPRSDIGTVSLHTSADELSNIIIENGHTRTLVYEDNLDNIIGFVHIKDLFNSFTQKKEFNLRKLVRKHIIAAPSMKLVDLLAEMRKRKTHIAVILDEYGGTDGIVTIEDVMEEIVGEIEDEHDAEDKVIEHYKIVNPHTILCNARVSIEEIEKILKLKLKKQDDYFETMGGLVLARAGHVPKSGATILIEDNIFAKVLEANSRSIKTIKLFVK